MYFLGSQNGIRTLGKRMRLISLRKTRILRLTVQNKAQTLGSMKRMAYFCYYKYRKICTSTNKTIGQISNMIVRS